MSLYRYKILWIPIGILFYIGFMTFKEMRFERVVFDKKTNSIEIKRRNCATLDSKFTHCFMDQVI